MNSKYPTWDTPYGNYNDFDPEPHWSDNFTPTRSQEMRVEALWYEFLEEAAAVCNLDTSEWDRDEYIYFKEFMHL